MAHNEQANASRNRQGGWNAAERFAAALARIENAMAIRQEAGVDAAGADSQALSAEVERLRNELAQVSEERDKFAAALYRLREENETLKARNDGAVVQIDQMIARVERLLSAEDLLSAENERHGR